MNNKRITELSEILNLDQIEMVKKPILEAHGLPNQCYTNQDYLSFEKEKIFNNNWVVIGTASSVPEIGDAKPYNLLGTPLIIIRDKSDTIRVFHNVCSHRGLKLIKEPCSIKNVIRCPYHSWSYNFEGELVATPHIGGMNKHEAEGFDKKKSNLKEVRSSVWMDLIFININNNAKNFSDAIKPLEDRWSKFIPKKDQGLIKHAKDYGYFNMEVNSNWKLAIENYCESYHLPTIHPELNKVSNINDHYHIQGLPNRFAGQGSKKYQSLTEGDKKFNTFKNWDKDHLQHSEYVALFPNVMIGLHIDHFYIFWLEPLATNKTKEHMNMYYVGNESANGDELKQLRKQNSKFWKDVMLEDISAIEGMQEGRGSPVYNGGNFSPVMDAPTHQFHKWVASNLSK